jgi:response regulator RpfG family c-di-GMP phosphodiesterase
LHNPRDRVIKAGMQDYISKPFNPAELNQKLSMFLQTGKTEPVNLISEDSWDYIQMDYLESISPGNKLFQIEIIELFEKQSIVFMKQAMAAFINGNFHLLQKLSHAFKPQGSYVGINSLSAIVAKLDESASQENNAETIAALLAQIQIILDHTQTETRKIKINLKYNLS